MFKGVRNAQELENFLWHLENYFKWNRVNNDESKINIIVLYLIRWTCFGGDIKSHKQGKDFAPTTHGNNSKWISRRLSSITTSSMRQSSNLGIWSRWAAYAHTWRSSPSSHLIFPALPMNIYYSTLLMGWKLGHDGVGTLTRQDYRLNPLRKPKLWNSSGIKISTKRKKVRVIHDHGGVDHGNIKDHLPYPMNHDTYNSDGKNSDVMDTKENGRDYQKKWLLHMSWDTRLCTVYWTKEPRAILQERKEKDAHDKEQGIETTQLGFRGLCGVITKL